MMLSSSYSVVKSLIQSLAPQKKESFLRFFSEADRAQIEKSPAIPISIPFEMQSKSKLLHFIHYSWFIPIIKSYSSINPAYFLHALSKLQMKKILPFLSITTLPEDLLKDPAKEYFTNLLLYSLIQEKNELLDPKLLFPSKLHPLLSLTKEQLVTVIDYLGLYDLAKMIFHIVDPQILKIVEKFLHKKKKAFFHVLMQKKHPLSFPPLQWDRKAETLPVVIHTRGLLRFSKAFCFQHNDFIWYISHKLDIGRGATLLKQSQKQIDPKTSDLLIKDILDVISYLNLHKPMETI